MRLLNLKFIKNKQKGFTIIELLISIGIFIVITSIVIANFHDAQLNDQLRSNANLVASVIEKAHNMSLAGQTIDGSVPIGGYGAHIDLSSPGEIIIFADADGCGRFNPGEELKNESLVLPEKIKFTSIDPESPLDIVFRPPKPAGFINLLCSAEGAVCANNVCSEGEFKSNGDEAIITIEHESSKLTKKILVNRISGQASVE